MKDGLQPGDLVVFHGIVGGSRGLCLIVEVKKRQLLGLNFYDSYAVALTPDMRLYEFPSGQDEGLCWDRVSDRG